MPAQARSCASTIAEIGRSDHHGRANRACPAAMESVRAATRSAPSHAPRAARRGFAQIGAGRLALGRVWEGASEPPAHNGAVGVRVLSGPINRIINQHFTGFFSAVCYCGFWVCYLALGHAARGELLAVPDGGITIEKPPSSYLDRTHRRNVHANPKGVFSSWAWSGNLSYCWQDLATRG